MENLKSEVIKNLASALPVDALVAEMLVNRGVNTPDAAR